jgi:hypothetical protein
MKKKCVLWPDVHPCVNQLVEVEYESWFEAGNNPRSGDYLQYFDQQL